MREFDTNRSIIGLEEPSLIKIPIKESIQLGGFIFGYFFVFFAPFIIVVNTVDKYSANQLYITILLSSMLGAILVFVIIFFIYRNWAKNSVIEILENGRVHLLEEFANSTQTKYHARRNFAIAALGDLNDINQLPFLINILLNQERIPWDTRRIAAYAVGKLGTYEAVTALNQAYILYKKPLRKMKTYSRYESIRIWRTQRTVKKILEQIAEINGYENIQTLT